MDRLRWSRSGSLPLLGLIVVSLTGCVGGWKGAAPDAYFNLTTTTVGSGTLTTNPKGTRFRRGTVIQLTATPATGYRVKSWQGTDNDTQTTATNQTTMNQDRQVRVTFELISDQNDVYYNLTVTSNGNGTLSANPSGTRFLKGTVVQLTANAASGYRVGSWQGTDDDTRTSSTNQATMNQDRQVRVTFERSPTQTTVEPPDYEVPTSSG